MKPARRHALVLAAIAIAACAGPAPAPEAPWRITLARGGGFTGMTTGYHLTSAGELSAWRQPAAGDEAVDWRVQVDPAAARARAEALRQALAGWQSDGTGNMTTRLVVARGDSQSTWTWSGSAPPADAPAAVRDWLQAFDEMIRKGRDE